jgi:hypothetical protein
VPFVPDTFFLPNSSCGCEEPSVYSLPVEEDQTFESLVTAVMNFTMELLAPAEQTWVPAEEFQPGDSLKSLNGLRHITNRHLERTTERVYNIEVDGDHVYRVGESGLLVHNVSDPCCGLPTVVFKKSRIPNIVNNIRAALQAGHPRVLRRVTSEDTIDDNRNEACGPVVCPGPGDPSNFISCDEYPFASSREGGSGARTKCVPKRENDSLGATLGNFYRANNIKNGDKYCVKTTDS